MDLAKVLQALADYATKREGEVGADDTAASAWQEVTRIVNLIQALSDGPTAPPATKPVATAPVPPHKR